jgi:DNA end-binding protein Ku
MAPRANWKGFLRMSLVTCPVALFPATSESEKISFNQINKKTGHRIRYLKVDAETGEEVSNEDIIKAYQVDKGQYLEVTKDDWKHRAGIHPHYWNWRIRAANWDRRSLSGAALLYRARRQGRPRRLRSDPPDKVALARVVLTNREDVIALEARDNYEAALAELLAKKQKGQPIAAAKKAAPSNVVNLMDALRASLKSGEKTPAKKATRKRKAGWCEREDQATSHSRLHLFSTTALLRARQAFGSHPFLAP